MKTVKKITAVMLALLMLVSTFSVAFTSLAATQKKVTKVSLNKTSITLYLDKTYTLKATVTPSDATNTKVKWSSSDTSIATVSSSGKVTAKKVGSATITCTARDGSGKKATCKVTVKRAVTSLKLNKTAVSLYLTKTTTLKATVSPSNATVKTVKWKSSKSSVASVSSDGVVTANKVGTATITCTSTDNSSVKATCTVTVKRAVTGLTLNKTSLNLYLSKTSTLKATISPSNATVKDVKWKSSNTDVATVSSSGKITAKKVGTATITCTSKDNSSVKATCKVTVKRAVTSVTLNKTSLNMYTTQTSTLKATVSPSNASVKTVKWTSSDSKIASVSSSGVVTAKKAGTVTITCTSTDNSSIKATCTVTVTKKVNIKSITLSSTSVAIANGSTKTITATVSPSNASVPGVTWTSSNPDVATVSSKGKITGVSVGTATITCTSKDNAEIKAVCKVTIKRPVTSVTLNKTSLDLLTTQTATLKATVKPSNATIKDVKWTSSDSKIASVSSSGVVTAKKAGTVTITCTSLDNSKMKATCTVKVTKKINVSSITLNKASISVTQGKTSTITATVAPSNASIPGVKWTSSNTSVATVSSKGKVTAVSVGTATITCTSTDNSEIKATCKVTVKPIKVSSITLNSNVALIYPGKTVILSATVSPDNAANKAVTWTSSNTAIATVSDDGLVMGIASGTATITCKAQDGSGKKATCKVTVGVPATGVAITTIESGNNAWYVGKTGKLNAAVLPGNATDKSVTWTSSKSDCVSVDSEGNVTVIKKKTKKNWLGQTKEDDDQTVTITATSNYNANIKATYTLTIVGSKVDVTGVSIGTTNTTGIWLAGKEYSVVANVVPEDASCPQIKYVSSDESIATVSSNGTVSVLKAGSVTITAVSADNEKIMSSLQLTTIEPKLDVRVTVDNSYFAVGEFSLLSYETNLDWQTLKTKFDGLKYEVNDPDLALVTQTDGYPYATIKFLKAGTVKVRVRTANNDIVSDWAEVKIRDIKIENDFFENVKVGDKIDISACIFDGKGEVTDSGLDLLYTTLYPELQISDDGTYVKVTEELESTGASISVTTSDGRMTRDIYFIPGKYTIPTSTADRLDLMKKLSNDMYTDNFLASYSRRVNYENLVSDKKNSSTDILFDWGLFKDIDLSGLMSLLGDSSSSSDVDADLEDLDFVETLFGENYVETSAAVQKDQCPKPMTVSADAVKDITVKDNGSTYTIKLTLNDQEKMLPDAVSASEYAKTMPVIDKAYLDDYIAKFNQIDGLTDGDESITISKISYGTVNQTYKNGYVEYTVDKFTDKVTNSVYHYTSSLDAKNAVLNLKADVEDMDIVMKINMKATFTMDVDNTLVLGDIVY